MLSGAQPRTRGAVEIVIVGLAASIDLVVWGGDRTLRDGALLPLWVVPTAIAAFSVVLFLRWRYPVGVWASIWVFSLAGLAVPRFQPFAGLLVALHAVASSRDRRTAGVVVALCTVPFAIDTANAAWASPHASFLVGVATFGVFWLVVTVAAWGFGRRSAVLRERASAETARALREARLALARDLHGSVANKINSMTMMAASLRLDDHPSRETLERIGVVGDRAIDELHRLLGLLRSVDGADGAGPAPEHRPGVAEIDTLVADVEATSEVTVVRAVLGEPRGLDESVDHLAHEVVAEALTNVVKYGGARARVDLTLCWSADELAITVRDAPQTPRRPRPAARSSGHGLPGLRESVSLVGGRFDAGADEHGFVVTAVLPAATTTTDGLAVPAPRIPMTAPRAG